MAEWLRWLISLSSLIIRLSHRCGWCGFEPHTGHMWDKSSSACGCVRWFSRGTPVSFLLLMAFLDMSEIILKGTLNWIQRKSKMIYKMLVTWTRWLPCPYMVKTLLKSSLQELVGWFHQSQAYYILSRVMRKPMFCICENKDADQLRGNREADQRLCFRYLDSTIPLLSKYKISSL